MIINKINPDGDIFTLEEPGGFISFTLPGYICLIINDPPMQQMFRNSRNLNYMQLQKIYPTIDKVYEDAECYKEGVTNKSKFLQVIHSTAFIKKHALSSADLKALEEFILRANKKFFPPIIVQQLRIKGYGRLADDIAFSDPCPELEQTCKLFWQFIQAVHTL